MALEAVVFQQDPFSYGHKDLHTIGSLGPYSYGFGSEKPFYWETGSCSPENCTGDGVPQVVGPASGPGRRKRPRVRSFKNREEMENQRMTHIEVERNRRKQMNQYLAVLQSLMPPSYAKRGDQASIVGGAINFVKELEQLVLSLEAHKQVKQQCYTGGQNDSSLFTNFFTFPQYSTKATSLNNSTGHESMAEKQSTIADIEVTMVESHVNIKVLSRRQPKQLLKVVSGFYSLGLTILHLNVTTVDPMVLYSLSVKVEEDCQLSTVSEIATTVHEMMGKILKEGHF